MPVKDGAFDSAELHLLAAGKRDSARLLAQMYSEWLTNGGTPGAFGLRGVIPYVLSYNEARDPERQHRPGSAVQLPAALY